MLTEICSVEQAGFKSTAILLPLHLQCWDYYTWPCLVLYHSRGLVRSWFLFVTCAFVGQRSGFVSSPSGFQGLDSGPQTYNSKNVSPLSHRWIHKPLLSPTPSFVLSRKGYWNYAHLKISKCMKQSSPNAHFNSLGQEMGAKGEQRSRINASEL